MNTCKANRLKARHFFVIKCGFSRVLRIVRVAMTFHNPVSDRISGVKSLRESDILEKVGFGSYGTFFMLKHPQGMGVKLMNYGIESATKELANLKKMHHRCPDLFPKPGELIRKGNHYGYTMEYVPMLTLSASARDTRLDVELVLEQVRGALHDVGIHHGDLHASNLLYCTKSGDFKVIDVDPQYMNTDESFINPFDNSPEVNNHENNKNRATKVSTLQLVQGDKIG